VNYDCKLFLNLAQCLGSSSWEFGDWVQNVNGKNPSAIMGIVFKTITYGHEIKKLGVSPPPREK
jgi:hypothetical protein